MTRGDLRDMARWRTAEHVQRWFTTAEPTLEALEARYGERIDGMSPTRMWVVEVNGRSVGFVRDYRVGDYPDYAVLGPDPDAIAVVLAALHARLAVEPGVPGLAALLDTPRGPVVLR